MVPTLAETQWRSLRALTKALAKQATATTKQAATKQATTKQATTTQATTGGAARVPNCQRSLVVVRTQAQA